MIWDLVMRNKVSGDGYSVTLGRRGYLIYEQGSDSYRVSVDEGGGYGIVVEQMASMDLNLMAQTIDRRLEVALNIKKALSKRDLVVDVYYQNRVVES